MSYMICVQVFIFPLAFGKEGVRRKAEEGGSELWAGAQPLSHFPFQPRPALCQPSFQALFSLPASCARHSIVPGMLFVCRNIIIASTWDTWSKQLRLIVYLHGVRCTLVSSILIQIDKIMAKHGHFFMEVWPIFDIFHRLRSYICSRRETFGFYKQATCRRPGDEPFSMH